jgi:phage shock protein C
MEKRLFKNRTNKMIGGVAAGFAEYFDIDVTLVRVLMVAAFFAPIPAVIPYIVLWILLPTKESSQITTFNYSQTI